MIAVLTVIMNIAVMKQMTIFGLEITGGNVMFATIFLANDVLNEHFGKKAARRAVLVGFAAGLIATILMLFMITYQPNEYDKAQKHLVYFFDVRMFGRIAAVSMISYLLAQILDTQIYAGLRKLTGSDKMLWFRSNASTWVSQAFDTLFFTTAALVGNIITTWDAWLGAVIFAYLIKIFCAAIQTVFLYATTTTLLTPKGSRRKDLLAGQNVTDE